MRTILDLVLAYHRRYPEKDENVPEEDLIVGRAVACAMRDHGYELTVMEGVALWGDICCNAGAGSLDYSEENFSTIINSVTVLCADIPTNCEPYPTLKDYQE